MFKQRARPSQVSWQAKAPTDYHQVQVIEEEQQKTAFSRGHGTVASLSHLLVSPVLLSDPSSQAKHADERSRNPWWGFAWITSWFLQCRKRITCRTCRSSASGCASIVSFSSCRGASAARTIQYLGFAVEEGCVAKHLRGDVCLKPIRH